MKWFYVNNVLPPDNMRVLIAVDDPARWVTIGTFDSNSDQWQDDNELPIEEFFVMAWSPLPDHPKNENDKVYLALVERHEKIEQEALSDFPF